MPKNIEQKIWITVEIQALLSVFAVHKDVDTIFGFIEMILWCTGGAIILAVMYAKTERFKKTRAATLGAFILTSSLAIGLLVFISYGALFQGPLKESGMVFIVFPFGYVKFGAIGAILGLLVHAFQKK